MMQRQKNSLRSSVGAMNPAALIADLRTSNAERNITCRIVAVHAGSGSGYVWEQLCKILMGTHVYKPRIKV